MVQFERDAGRRWRCVQCGIEKERHRRFACVGGEAQRSQVNRKGNLQRDAERAGVAAAQVLERGAYAFDGVRLVSVDAQGTGRQDLRILDRYCRGALEPRRLRQPGVPVPRAVAGKHLLSVSVAAATAPAGSCGDGQAPFPHDDADVAAALGRASVRAQEVAAGLPGDHDLAQLVLESYNLSVLPAGGIVPGHRDPSSGGDVIVVLCLSGAAGVWVDGRPLGAAAAGVVRVGGGCMHAFRFSDRHGVAAVPGAAAARHALVCRFCDRGMSRARPTCNVGAHP